MTFPNVSCIHPVPHLLKKVCGVLYLEEATHGDTRYRFTEASLFEHQSKSVAGNPYLSRCRLNRTDNPICDGFAVDDIALIEWPVIDGDLSKNVYKWTKAGEVNRIAS